MITKEKTIKSTDIDNEDLSVLTVDNEEFSFIKSSNWLEGKGGLKLGS